MGEVIPDHWAGSRQGSGIYNPGQNPFLTTAI
jgi:hypothetical protein